MIPVFAPPREPGFQNAIEGFNALWQTKVWQRHHCRNVAALETVSAHYIVAHRAKTATRREATERAGLEPKKRGRKADPTIAEVRPLAKLTRENERLRRKLAQAYTIIDVQKNSTLLAQNA